MDNNNRELYESSFNKAIENREFAIWAQPKYNTFNKRITSAEALVRWRREDGSFISPGAFIPIFESDGLIIRLDEYIFSSVCALQKELYEGGKHPVPISVNLSRKTLLMPNVVEVYHRIVLDAGIPMELVPIELTESATVEDVQINGLVQKLKDEGFYLHLDDFGSGYSSMACLNNLKMDALKLDKSLVDGIGDRGGDEIIRHIIELAHFFQMEVVAEGVETDDQYNFLKKLSCDTIQGFYFSRPVPFNEFIELLKYQPSEVSEFMDGQALAEEASVGSLRITNDAKLQYLSALARIYMTMHVIDLKEDTVIEFATTTNVKEHCNKVHDCVSQMKAAMSATVAPDYVDAVLRFTDLTNITFRMKGKKTMAEQFVGKHFGRFEARFITVTANADEEPEKLIYTTRVVESDKTISTSGENVCITDELTGLYNYVAFEKDKKDMSINNYMSVMSVDVNGLNAVNREFGHSAGDEMIWGAADILNKTIGKYGKVYRLVNDRLVALFYADPGKVNMIRYQFKEDVDSWVGNRIRKLSVSFGIASAAEVRNATVDEVLKEADRRRLQYKAELRSEK